MTFYDLPERWLRELERYTDEKYGPAFKYRGRLSVYDFADSKTLKVTFGDRSVAFFRYAFTLEIPTRREVMIFTEHCGYHLLSNVDLLIEDVTDQSTHQVKLNTGHQ